MSNILVTSRLILDSCVVDYISSILGSTQIFINFSNASLIAPKFTSVLDNLEQIILFLSFIAFFATNDMSGSTLISLKRRLVELKIFSDTICFLNVTSLCFSFKSSLELTFESKRSSNGELYGFYKNHQEKP